MFMAEVDGYAQTGYALVLSADRIDAVDTEGHGICGAYLRCNYWVLYETALVTAVTGMTIPPHHEHFWAAGAGYEVAKARVELIACLYAMAIQNRRQTA